MQESFLKGITPFIQNMKKGQVGAEPATKKISENGKYDTIQNSKVDVKVEGGGPEPQGNVEITTTQQVNVAGYATAQVVDEDLKPENIKKDVVVLDVTGTLEDDLEALMQETF